MADQQKRTRDVRAPQQGVQIVHRTLVGRGLGAGFAATQPGSVVHAGSGRSGYLTPDGPPGRHKPLGNSNRARRRMYWELARLRQHMNGVEHVEPTGDEVFPDSQPSPSPAR